MIDFKFVHKKEKWLYLTIKAYDFNLALINIKKCDIDINEYNYKE